MARKWQANLLAFQTRSSVLASLLTLLLLAALAGQASSQGPGAPIIFTQQDIQGLVDDHNLFRGMVEPTASNMQAVVSSMH